MSSSRCVVFIGVRYEPGDDELDALETRSHSLMVSARKVGLKHYWANFGWPGEKYFVFVGKQLGVFGPEDMSVFQMPRELLLESFEETERKLRDANITGEPQFWVQWLPAEG